MFVKHDHKKALMSVTLDTSQVEMRSYFIKEESLLVQLLRRFKNEQFSDL
jgi:hypothetical protein